METYYQNSYWYNQNQPQQGNYYNYDQSYDYNSYYYPPYNYYYQQQEVQQQQPINEINQNNEIPPVFQAHEESWSIPTVIRQIFSYLPISEVKVMRKVCKKWNEEGRKILQEKVTIELRSFNLLDSYCRDFKDNNNVLFFGSSFSLGPEINLNSLQLKHFCTYFGSQIKSLEINSQIGIELFKEFLQDNVLDISHLRLSTNIVDPDPHYNHDNSVPINGLQNLKSLHFLRGESNKPENLKVFLKEIVFNAPNLETFGLTKVKDSKPPLDNIDDLKSSEELQTMLLDKSSSDLDQELWSFLLSSSKETLRKLKKINLNPPKPLTIESVQKLSQRKFQLETIDLKLSAQVTNKALHNLLTSLKGSIKNIKIQYCGNGNRLKYEADLPLNEPLLKLEKLELVEYKGNLFFMENVPNLQHLILRNVDLNGIVLKDVDSSKKKPEGIYETLKTLQVYQDKSNNCGNHKQRSIQTVQKLGIQFPSVRKVRLEKLVDESLCLLYAQWPNLEELEIVHGQFSDAGTTAIHPNAYKVILREQAYDNFILNVDALRQGLFLGNLSRLHTLKMHSPNITDVTLILGVLQCTNIQTLYVKSRNITDAALYRLLKLTTIKHLVIEDCKLSPEAVAFTSRKLNERGGTSSLNQRIGSMDVFQVVEFLQRSPKLKVLLKRASTQEENHDEQVVHEENPEMKLKVSKKNNRPMPARRQMMMRKVNGSTEEKVKQSMTTIIKESCNESLSIDTSTTTDISAPIEVIQVPRKRTRITRSKPDFIEIQIVREKNLSDEIIAQESNLATILEATESPPIGLRPKTRRNKIKDQQETTKNDNGESLSTKVQNIVILENNVKPTDSKSKEAQSPAKGKTKRRPTRDQQKPIFIRFKDFALF